jgi:hypothetical protein
MRRLVLALVRIVILLRYRKLAKYYRRVDMYGRHANPASPRTANDKFFWRKVFDLDPRYTQVSDKVGVRDFFKEHDIKVPCPDLLWTGDRAEDIPDDLLASGVAVKANHGWATNIILPEAPPDRAAFNTLANSFLSKRHARSRHEWAYFDIKPTLFVERLVDPLVSETNIFTYNGAIPRVIIRYPQPDGSLLDDNWLRGPDDTWTCGEPAVKGAIMANQPMPPFVPQMLETATEIGRHFDFIRVDYLATDTQCWLGELTVYPGTGQRQGIRSLEDHSENICWDIRKSRFFETPQRGWRGLYQRALLADLNARAEKANSQD